MTALINALRISLSDELAIRKSRLESFCVLVVGVLVARTVNLSHLAGSFPGRAEVASNYRRLQRFFEQVHLDQDALARIIVRLAGLGKGPWVLAMDRTNWKLGRCNINILMVAVLHDGIAVPLLWSVMARAGTSTIDQREALMSRFCAIFGDQAIGELIADREFIGARWMHSLDQRKIPFILRIKEEFYVHLESGRCCSIKSLFQKLAIGRRRYITDEVVLGLRRKDQGPPLKLAATRLASGELLVVATNTEPKSALANYRRRWQIETLFAACKSRGFNLEDTHLTHPERIAKLLSVLAIAFAFSHATGQWRAKHRHIIIRAHKRKAQSIFRYGYDLLRCVLLTDMQRAITIWRGLIAGKPPNPRLLKPQRPGAGM